MPENKSSEIPSPPPNGTISSKFSPSLALIIGLIYKFRLISELKLESKSTLAFGFTGE
jgi:hypothetical protein